jgi:mRNA-degrading endonuclease RelE of RelBE toxin-antitoxin system
MSYSVNFSRQAIKDLEKISDPFYSHIKQAILT